MFHVTRQELERKFEIVLLAEDARMELKSSTKMKAGTYLVRMRHVLSHSKQKNTELWWLEGPKKDHRRIKEGSKNGQITAAETTHNERRSGNIVPGSVANKH
jgi:hypothetical protein